MFLLNATGLSRGNLSTHLQKLEEGGLVRSRKSFKEKRPNTQVSLTARGRRRIEEHWHRLERLRQSAEDWRTTRAKGAAASAPLPAGRLSQS